MKRISCVLLLLVLTTGLFAEKVKIIDYKQKGIGADIPEWVLYAGSKNKKKLDKKFGNKGNTKYWIVERSGEDLDFLSEWFDFADISLEIEQKLIMDGFGVIQSAAEVPSDKKSIVSNSYFSTFNMIHLNGLELVETYWIKTKDSEGKEQYTYYAVYAMDKEVYEKQMSFVIKHFDSNLEDFGIQKAPAKSLIDKLEKTIY